MIHVFIAPATVMFLEEMNRRFSPHSTESVTVETEVVENGGRTDCGGGAVDTDTVFSDCQDQHVEEHLHAALTYCLCDLGYTTFPSISFHFPLCISSGF